MSRQRVVVIYNPRSSKYVRVREEVLNPISRMTGVMVGRYEIKPTNVDDNARNIAQILLDGDLVVAAGGDGTAMMGLNGVVLSGKQVRFAVLPYGNFNDLAGMLGCKTIGEIIANLRKTKKMYPIEALVDGEHFRYAACYFTLGMFAESTRVFDAPRVRTRLKKGNKGIVYSVKTLAGWWISNRKKEFLPRKGFLLNGKKVSKRATDVMVVNSSTVAKVMRTKEARAFKNRDVLIVTGNFGNIFKLLWFMLKSMVKRMPGNVSPEMRLEFDGKTGVEIQAEGECKKIECEQIVAKKCIKPIEVVVCR